MIGGLRQANKLLWDPVYKDLSDYSTHYDYDLLGNKVRFQDRFLDDPNAFIEEFVRDNLPQIIIYGLVIVLFLITFIFTKGPFINGIVQTVHSVWAFIAVCLLNKKYKKLKEQIENPNFDMLAARVYRNLVKAEGLYSYKGRTDMAEYEASRFVLETIKQTGLCYEELLTLAQRPTDGDNETEDYNEDIDFENDSILSRV